LPEGLSAWVCLLGKNGAFLETWEHAFWPSPECQEPFSMLSRHTMSSNMVWNAGDGPWWAPTADVLRNKDLCSAV
jgi:hypothetical protein